MAVAGPRTVSKRVVVRRRPSRPSVRSMFFNLFARAAAWYLLYMALFSCPSQPSENSPLICQSTHALKNKALPYIRPYYDSYVSPYVDEFSPYVRHAGQEYVIPAYGTASKTYRKYGEPLVLKGKDFAGSKYDEVVEPHVVSTRMKIRAFYMDYMHPYVATANEFWAGAEPRIRAADQKLQHVWQARIVPAYEKALPYLELGYEHIKKIILNVVVPVVRQGSEKAMGWSKGVWSDVVQSQVGRIAERLGANGATGASAGDVFSSPTAKDAASSSAISSMISSVSSKASVSASKAAETAKVAPEKAATKLSKAEERGIIDADLKAWKAKFASSTDQAIADLKSQIDEISDTALSTHKENAAKEVDRLQSSASSGLKSLKAEIADIMSILTPESSQKDKDRVQEKIYKAVRAFGLTVRDQTQAIRKTSESHLSELYDEVSDVTDQHLDVLDSFVNMGMQELGMKWAWMDHVNWKDWKKYHDLKKDMRKARSRIIKSAEDNKNLSRFTKWAEKDWQGRATEIAREAAESLTALKQMVKKKIDVGNAADLAGSARQAGQQILNEAEQVKDTIASAAATVEVVTSSAPSIISRATQEAKARVPFGVHAGFVEAREEPIMEDPDFTDAAASRISEASKAVSQAINEALHRATATSELGYAEAMASRASELSDVAFSAASSALYGTPPPATEKLAAIATDKYSAAVAAASSVIYGTPTPTHEVIMSKITEAYASATSAAIDASKAASRLASGEKEKTAKESMISYAKQQYDAAITGAQDQYSALVDAGTDARKRYESAVAEAEKSFNEAKSAASTKVYGTPQPASESIISAANAKYSQALADAQNTYDSWYSSVSVGIYGTPTGSWESATSIASDSVESAASVASGYLFGTPAPSSVDAAAASIQSRYDDLQNLMSELIHGKEPTFSESVVSRFNMAVYGTPTPVWQQATQRVADTYAYATDAAASFPPAVESAVADAQKKIKELVYGPEKSTSEDILDRIKSAQRFAEDQVRIAIYGTPKGTYEHATSTIKDNAQHLSDLFANAQKRIEAVAAEAEHKLYEFRGSVKDTAEGVGEKARSATERIKDEL